jgi:hypothetical protein
MSPSAKAFFVAILAFSQTFLAWSACQGDDCKVEAPQDEVSLLQTKMNSTTRAGPPHYPSDVEFSNTCPANWVVTHDGVNTNVMTFINTCLKEITLQNSNAKIRSIIDGGCTGPYTDGDGRQHNGKLVEMKGGNGKFKMNFKGKGAGGVCSAKMYTGKCTSGSFSTACKSLPLYRVFNTGNRAYSDYWVATKPSEWGGSKDEYRDATAICKAWNRMENIATYNLNDKACNLVFVIGNGEAVDECSATESYGYSTALQIGVCPYQAAAMTEVHTEAWH